jgi:hypothetical protein
MIYNCIEGFLGRLVATILILRTFGLEKKKTLEHVQENKTHYSPNCRGIIRA